MYQAPKYLFQNTVMLLRNSVPSLLNCTFYANNETHQFITVLYYARGCSSYITSPVEVCLILQSARSIRIPFEISSVFILFIKYMCKQCIYIHTYIIETISLLTMNAANQ